MEIIKIWKYHQRLVFLTKIEDKYQMFYKSAGLNDGNSKGSVFPILRLKEKEGHSPDGFGQWNSIGWLPKLYLHDDRFVEYRYKIRREFPESMYPYMDELESIIENDDMETAIHPRTINSFVGDYIRTKEDYFDWKRLS